MASKVEIANRALTKLGQSRILTLTDDVKAAREVNSCFDILRDAELRANNWSFSIKRTQLAALVSTPAWGFDNQFQLPSDYLKLLAINDSWRVGIQDYITGPSDPFKIEGGKILTDMDAPLKIRYVARIEDTGLYDACFVEALACRIAAEVCESLTQSTSKKDVAWSEYKQAIDAAHAANAIEVPSEVVADDTWILSRL